MSKSIRKEMKKIDAALLAIDAEIESVPSRDAIQAAKDAAALVLEACENEAGVLSVAMLDLLQAVDEL